ncbi:MAG: hypothetical protein MOB07_31510 [Acidobacteria bacterium]|nr:hypothetical protein [Acidobacteriota bacterium]
MDHLTEMLLEPQRVTHRHKLARRQRAELLAEDAALYTQAAQWDHAAAVHVRFRIETALGMTFAGAVISRRNLFLQPPEYTADVLKRVIVRAIDKELIPADWQPEPEHYLVTPKGRGPMAAEDARHWSEDLLQIFPCGVCSADNATVFHNVWGRHMHISPEQLAELRNKANEPAER